MKIIVGGGIAGLWLASEFKALNIPFIILESSQLGCSQTLASQGIIHGGTKYSLDGTFSKASKEISNMPNIWRGRQDGDGSFKLGKEVFEKNFQHIWTIGNLKSKLSTFFASRLMNSKLEKLNYKEDEFFRNANKKISLYKLNEPIINVKELLKNLSTFIKNNIFKAEVNFLLKNSDEVIGVSTNLGDIYGSEVFLMAGEGNKTILENSNISDIKMQSRPLAMTLVSSNKKLPKIFGHYIELNVNPIMTISSHHTDNKSIYYLGGNIAEEGVKKSDTDHINHARKILTKTIPWIDFSSFAFSTYRINRSEGYLLNNTRPNNYVVIKKNNLNICWPTKLTLVPLLVNELLNNMTQSNKDFQIPNLPHADIGDYPWD